jgi:catechol 2,3-dioxygenase-like lactoylglutathione lyase family enzyme
MSEPQRVPDDPLIFDRAVPILRVRDLDASIAYYVNVLHFKVDWHVTGYASISRGRCGLMLSQRAQGHPGAWVWIGVSDADALWEEFRAKGARLRHPPTNYAWAYEMQIFDLDGHVLRFGAEPKPDQPEGEWLDEEGHAWLNGKIVAKQS